MPGRILGQRVCEPFEAVAGERVGHDEYPRVRALVGKEAERERDKVVAVPRHETAAFLGGAFELLQIRERERPDLMGANGIDAPRPQDFGDLRAQVLVQVIFQRRSGASEG